MASFEVTVGMCIVGLTTLVTMGYHIIGNPFTQTFVKYKILTGKLNRNIFLPCFADIFYDTSLNVVDVLKPFIKHISTCFFTTDATSTIHHDVLIFMLLQHFYGHGQLLTKGFGGYFYCIFK